MPRYIDADAFKEKYGDYYAEEGTTEGFIGTVGQLIDNAPTVELHLDIWEKIADYEGCDRVQIEQNGKQYEFVKKRKGKWEFVQYDANPNIGNWHCTNCRGIAIAQYNFCPICGAEMRGDV